MKLLDFTIDIYDWDVIVIEAETKNDAKKVNTELKKYNIPKNLRNPIVNEIKNGSWNGGDHLYLKAKRWSIIFIGLTRGKGNRLEIIAHEKRHVEDTILEHLNIKDKESAAFLAGYIAKKLAPIFKNK